MTEPATSAYDLLSRPTLDLSDAEVELIIADLRKKRTLYIAGTDDKPKAEKKKALAASADEKKANALSFLAQLQLKAPE